MPKNNQSSLSSATLIVLGEDLDPSEVTRVLGMFPDQAWRAGEVPQVQTPNGRWIESPRAVEWGGWKKFMPRSLNGEILEVQLEHWAGELESRAVAIESLRARDWSVTLDCFLTASEVEITGFSAELL